MARHMQETRWLYSSLKKLLADLPHVLFFFFVLPLLLLFLLIPSSWYLAEGYADLGVVDFVASEADTRIYRHDPFGHGVIYRATDGSGLSFREADTRYFVHAAVETRQHVRRHVYISHKRPQGILKLFRLTTGQIFLPVGEDLQSYLNVRRRVRIGVCGVGVCYTAVYGAVAVCRRRRGGGFAPTRRGG